MFSSIFPSFQTTHLLMKNKKGSAGGKKGEFISVD
jgi:hypothetical protein